MARAGAPERISRLPVDAQANVVCENNLKYMHRLDDESIQLIVTSPPYNIGKEYEHRTSLDRYVEEQTACIAQAVRVLHPSGSICWQVGNHVDDGEVFPLDIILYNLFKHHGLRLRNRIVWDLRARSALLQTVVWQTRNDPLVHQDRRLCVQP